MPKMIGIKEASKETGLSEWELKRGMRDGDYPYIRIGEGRGKFLFDIELLRETLRNRAIENMTINQPQNVVPINGIRRVEA